MVSQRSGFFYMPDDEQGNSASILAGCEFLQLVIYQPNAN